MKSSGIKKLLLTILILALVLAAYSPSAFCVSPSPSPSESATPSPSPSESSTPSPSPSVSPTDEEPGGSEEPAESPSTFKILTLDDKGTDVIRVQMRLRDLGYFNYRATGKYYSKTEKAVLDFQNNNSLDADGRVGEMTYAKLFETEGLARKPLSPSVTPSSGPKNENPQVSGELGDWETVSAAFTVGMTVKVTDVNKPEITFNVTRSGGTNLAWVEAATTKDYNSFLECFGGEVNWEKRSVLVTIGGTEYAASMFGNPSGDDTISGNGMEGHTTLYFYGSKSEVLGFEDKEDLAFVLRAAGKPEKYPDEP